MALLRSTLMSRVESVFTALGWFMAPAEGELEKFLPNTAPLSCCWRWVSVETVPAGNQPGMATTPMQKDLTFSIEYMAQVAKGRQQDDVYKYAACDLVDMAAGALLDRKGPLFAVVDGPSLTRSSILSCVIGRDGIRPPGAMKMLTQMMGYLTFTIRAQIDVRTDLTITETSEA